jgi:hypothetical protein
MTGRRAVVFDLCMLAIIGLTVVASKMAHT